MRLIFFVALVVTFSSSVAQPFLMGSSSASFYDASRNRTVAADVYYPGATAGNNVAVSAGAFPVLVFGHGFVMSVDAYANIWNYFVPRGYIVVLPTTEGGFAPSHGDFGADLAFLVNALQAANADVASPFFGHVAPASALLGHSMGGGASVLGAAGNSTIQALVSFAPAETNPSAVAAAANVLVPTMIFAASEDCVAPIADHQGPIYNALTVPCRAFVNIQGGGHCYFAESNFNCSFGEITCGPDLTISRGQQHVVMNDFAGLWLDHYLKGDQQALPAVLDSLANSTRVQAEFTCLSTDLAELNAGSWSVGVIANDQLFLGEVPASAFANVFDGAGRRVLAFGSVTTGGILDVSALPMGTYRLVLLSAGAARVHPFVVIR